ncbi:MAG: hypothetical protein Q4E47_01020 [Candidatus Saccharibacteria bacterium]|nr:hypothetical protein [Candidatus Saccharibacteria bacterium]
MFKFILSKTVLKDLTKESQDKAYMKNGYNVYAFYLSHAVPVLLLMSATLAPTLVFSIVDKNYESKPAYQAICLVMLIMEVFYLVLAIIFSRTIECFIGQVASRIIFWTKTRRGDAIKRKDFKYIRKNLPGLYQMFHEYETPERCYAVCYHLLKHLKDGEMEFVADEHYHHVDPKQDAKEFYTMHALYIRNGWAYDTNCNHQMPVERVRKIYGHKLYKKFTYEDVKDIDHDAFFDREAELAKVWGKENDCYVDM